MAPSGSAAPSPHTPARPHPAWPTRPAPVSDAVIAVAAPGDAIGDRCGQALCGAGMVERAELSTRAARVTLRGLLNAELNAVLATKTSAQWIDILNTAGVPCGPIYSIDQMFADDQVQHLGIAQDVPNAENRHIRLVGQPVTLSWTPSKLVAAPPEFGEQTDEVLAECGFSKAEIADLRQGKGG